MAQADRLCLKQCRSRLQPLGFSDQRGSTVQPLAQVRYASPVEGGACADLLSADAGAAGSGLALPGVMDGHPYQNL